MIFLDILFSRTMWWRLFERYLHCTYIYVALTVFSYSHYDIVNHSAGLIMSYHMFDAVIRGMVAPPDKVAYTNTINDVLCISDTLLSCLVMNSSGKIVPNQLYPKMMRNFNKLVCYYIWTSGIIWTFWIQILQ